PYSNDRRGVASVRQPMLRSRERFPPPRSRSADASASQQNRQPLESMARIRTCSSRGATQLSRGRRCCIVHYIALYAIQAGKDERCSKMELGNRLICSNVTRLGKVNNFRAAFLRSITRNRRRSRGHYYNRCDD